MSYTNNSEYISKKQLDLTSSTSFINEDTYSYHRNQLISTSKNYSLENQTKYFIISNGYEILSNVFNHMKNIESKQLKENLTLFSSYFLKSLSLHSDIDNIPTNLPHMLINKDNGSVHLEWIFKYLRAGFIIEESFEKSSWYILIKDKENDRITMKDDDLNLSNLFEVVSAITELALENV